VSVRNQSQINPAYSFHISQPNPIQKKMWVKTRFENAGYCQESRLDLGGNPASSGQLALGGGTATSRLVFVLAFSI
jgi:hypothetical protein